ncbi:MAG: hypothetical protein M3138_00735 [Actinomycetota bacterium]|nr:hypothetical protein [Actinomycetota bacterium]
MILCFFVLQSVLFPRDRPPGWDEAVYLSQVTPGAEPAFFAGWRARGVTLVIAPAMSAGASIADVRTFLIILSTASLGLTLSVWIPLIGVAASLAAFLFSFSWIALLNASQVMPNFWAAVLGLAAAGFTIRGVEGERSRHIVFASAALAATALIRPTEATVVFVVLGAYVLLGRKRSGTALLALTSGLVLGWLPWMIEMSVRFGGPLQALREAASGPLARAPAVHNALRHLSYTDGELVERVLPVPGIVWWGMLGLLSVVGLLRATREERVAGLVASFAALAVTIEYLVFVPVSAARFLLPAYAFLAVPASIGLVSLLRGRTVARSAGVIVLLLAIPWTIWQASVAERVEMASRQVNERFREVGHQLMRLAADAPCSFLSPHGYPQIQIASGCAGDELRRARGPSEGELDRLRDRGGSVFVLLRNPVRPSSLLGAVEPMRFSGSDNVWFIYHLPARPEPTEPTGAG